MKYIPVDQKSLKGCCCHLNTIIFFPGDFKQFDWIDSEDFDELTLIWAILNSLFSHVYQKTQKNIFNRKFPLFRPNFRGKRHFQRDETSDARVESSMKLFVSPRASILAMIDSLGLQSWHLVANLLKKRLKTTPSRGQIFLKFFFEVSFNELLNIHKEFCQKK